MDLTRSQWSLLSPLVVPDNTHTHRGRPFQDAQAVLNGIFWVLRTGARWADLPARYPPHQTCHRRFREWLTNGTLVRCFQILADDLHSRTEPRPVAEDDSAAGLRSPTEQHPIPTLPNGARSWRWHTTLLLESPVARKALGTTAGTPVASNDTQNAREQARNHPQRPRRQA